jgi:monoterpene epsilon-lactone hydrolase
MNEQAGISVGAGAGESRAQRLTAAVVRGLTRVMLGPTFKAGHATDQRRRRQEQVSRLMRAPRGVEYRPSVCGEVPGQSVSKRGVAPADRVILYLHGGGYCQGSPSTHRTLTGNLALRCSAQVFAPDYRLAPEQPFPAALADAVAAYRGLLAQGFAPSAMILAGDSAGGGLAVATALRLRELGLPRPAALVLLSPWVDLSGSALGPPAPADIITKPFVEECARTYLAGHPAGDPLASPIAGELHGLPPTLIQVGGDELLLTDSRRLDAALAAAGVEVLLQVFPHRWHVFQLLAGPLADANRALAAVGEFVRAHTAVGIPAWRPDLQAGRTPPGRAAR